MTSPTTASEHNRAAGATVADFWSSVLPEPHRCAFGSSGRCACGRHRDPATVGPLSTDRERLAFQL